MGRLSCHSSLNTDKYSAFWLAKTRAGLLPPSAPPPPTTTSIARCLEFKKDGWPRPPPAVAGRAPPARGACVCIAPLSPLVMRGGGDGGERRHPRAVPRANPAAVMSTTSVAPVKRRARWARGGKSTVRLGPVTCLQAALSSCSWTSERCGRGRTERTCRCVRGPPAPQHPAPTLCCSQVGSCRRVSLLLQSLLMQGGVACETCVLPVGDVCWVLRHTQPHFSVDTEPSHSAPKRRRGAATAASDDSDATSGHGRRPPPPIPSLALTAVCRDRGALCSGHSIGRYC